MPDLALDLSQSAAVDLAYDFATGIDATVATILGPLLHSNWDLAAGGSTFTTGSGLASVSNIGTSTTPLLQATGSRQPIRTSWGNGLWVARFDGSNDSLMAILSPSLPSGSRPYIWAVLAGNVASQPINRYLLTLQDATYANGLAVLDITADRFAGSRYNGTSDNQNTTIPIGMTRHSVEIAEPPSALGSFVVDGAIFNGAGERVPTAALTHMVIASYFLGGSPFGFAHVDVGQVVIASAQPTAAQILAMRALLKTKWGTL